MQATYFGPFGPSSGCL